MQDRRKNLRRETDCPFEVQIQQLTDQCNRIEEFINDANPLMTYVRGEITRNERRSEMYRKISENVLGASIIAILGIIGSWAIEKLKLDFWGK
jgi:hypothetical protein